MRSVQRIIVPGRAIRAFALIRIVQSAREGVAQAVGQQCRGVFFHEPAFAKSDQRSLQRARAIEETGAARQTCIFSSCGSSFAFPAGSRRTHRNNVTAAPSVQ
ncbi:hypothetical protein [Methylobacterium sp. PvR107]|uniref:hypothetical protein n=1 Tax=Methylobacterium sp. PvR107 TaxID=2806597 RepID=UPI001B792322|nr:hypothetical protein [Methylobacterium sp. PvR107]MBP1179549.1 hypothetical protein [Methylobacterium sp. PvR107]